MVGIVAVTTMTYHRYSSTEDSELQMNDLHKFVKSVTHKNHLAKDIHELTKSATHQKRSMEEFYKLVKSTTPEQRTNLAKLTGAGFGDSPQSLHDHNRMNCISR